MRLNAKNAGASVTGVAPVTVTPAKQNGTVHAPSEVYLHVICRY